MWAMYARSFGESVTDEQIPQRKSAELVLRSSVVKFSSPLKPKTGLSGPPVRGMWAMYARSFGESVTDEQIPQRKSAELVLRSSVVKFPTQAKDGLEWATRPPVLIVYS